MATLDWQLRDGGDATLVELLVTSDVDARVEIESILQPVWPPRRQNRPAAGWDESGFEGVVTAGEPLVLGYASPDDPAEPPATIVETEPLSETPEEPPTPEALVRELGEAGPPRDAIPTPGESTPSDQPPATNGTASAHDTPPADHAPPNGSASVSDRPPSSGEQPSNGTPPGGDQQSVEHPPGEAVDVWLDEAERRIETAERLAAVETAAEARAAVSAAGGIADVRRLCEQLDADRERVERIERVASGERLGAVDVPLSALERLA